MTHAIIIISIGLSVGILSYYVRMCLLSLRKIEKDLDLLRLVTRELSKQQMMEAHAIEDLAEFVIYNKHKSKSKYDDSEPIFKSPQGEA